MHNTHPQLDPAPILQTAFAFWSSKVLLTAVDFGVFTKLGDRRITGAKLGAEIGLHPRGISDFFDALVAMKFLDREGDGPEAKYFNTPAGALYLDCNSPGTSAVFSSCSTSGCSSSGTTCPRPYVPGNRRTKPRMARRESSRSFTRNCRDSNSSWAR